MPEYGLKQKLFGSISAPGLLCFFMSLVKGYNYKKIHYFFINRQPKSKRKSAFENLRIREFFISKIMVGIKGTNKQMGKTNK